MAITLDNLTGPSVTGGGVTLAPALDAPAWQSFQGQEWQTPLDPVADAANKEWTDYRAKATKQLDEAALDPDTFFKGQDMSFGRDVKDAQMLATNDAFLTLHNNGDPLPEGDMNRRLAMKRAAEEMFDGEGGDSEESLYGQIVKSATSRKTNKELFDGITDTAVQAITSGAVGEQATTFQAWREEAKKKPGYDPTKDWEYLHAWTMTQYEAKDAIEPFKDELAGVWKAMKAGGAGTASEVIKSIGADLLLGGGSDGKDTIDELSQKDAGAVAFDAYDKLAPEDRPAFMDGIHALVKSFPKEEQPAVLANLSKSGGRMVDDLARGAFSRFSVKGIEQSLNEQIAGSMGPLGASETEKAQASSNVSRIQADRLAQKNFSDSIRKMERGEYAPVRYFSNDSKDVLSWRTAEEGLYGVPGVLASVGTVMTPGVGPSAMFLAMEDFAYGDLRDNAIRAGMDEAGASVFADKWKTSVAVPQTALEILQTYAPLGKIPAVNKVLGSIGDKIGNRLTRFAIKSAAISGAETAVEEAQYQIPYLAQSVAHAFAEDSGLPATDWHNGRDGAFDGFWNRQATTFLSMLPIAAAGAAGGLSEESRARAFAEATPLQRRAYGITDEMSAGIDAAATRGQSSLNAAVDEALSNRVPESEQARAAVAELEAEIAAKEAEATATQKSAVMPTFIRTAEGWSIRDGETGEEVGTANNPAGALSIAADHSAVINEKSADQVAFLATMLEAGESTTNSNSVERTTTFEFSPGKKVTAAQEAAISPKDEARVMEQIQAREGQSGMADIVLGKSVTEFKQRARNTANKINAGGSVLTVFHEEAHGYFREALNQGRLTKPETIEAIRALETALVGNKTKAGDDLRFLPDGEVTDTQLDEAVSELMEAEVIRNRKNSDKVPAGIISKNLSAMARLAPGATKKLSSFVNTVRDYFGLAFSRAYEIRKGIKEGKIKESDIEAFTNKLFGLDAQDQHDTAAVKARDELLGEGDPFSLGKERPMFGESNRLTNLNPKGGMMTAIIRENPGFNPSADEVKVFRSSIGEELRTNDFVALSKAIAAEHLENLKDRGESGKVREFTVKTQDLLMANDATEFVWFPFDPGISLSLGPARMADVLQQDAAKRITDPKEIAAMFERMSRNMGDLKRDRDEIGVAFGKDFKRKAIEDPRKTASINKEAAFREASRRAELEDEARARHGDILENSDLVKLKEQPVHAFLADPDSPLRGQLMSPSQAIARGVNFFDPTKQGDYDGSGNISRSVFGGTLAPDQAAQELFDEGLIREPTADAMWQALEKEQATVARMKDYLKAAQADMKAARVTAKAEAAKWKTERLAEEKRNYSPKARLLRALAMMDGIISALPISERGRIGGYTQLAKLGTDEARLKFLSARIDKVEDVMNAYLSKEYGKMLDKLLERAKPVKGKPGEKPKGKAGAEIHAVFDVLREARGWSQDAVDQHVDGLLSSIASGNLTPEQEAKATMEAALVGLVGNWKEADTSRRAAAIKAATDAFDAGYAKFKLATLFKAEDRRIRQANLEKDTGATGDAGERDAKMLADHGLKGGWKDNFLSLVSFEQVNEYLFGRGSKEATRLVDMEREAAAKKEDLIQGKMDALDDLFTRLGGSQLAGEKLRWKMSQKNVKVAGRTLSEMEMVTATLMWRQEDGRRHMLGTKDENGNYAGKWHYDQAFVDSIESKLSDEAKAVRAHIAADYQTEHAEINPTFRELNGIDLPSNPNYSPLTVKPQQASGQQSIDPVTGSTMSGTSSTPGSLRTRGTAIAEPDFRDALQTYIAHKKQIYHWLAYSPFLSEAGPILRNRDVGNAIEGRGGQQAVSVMRGWLDYFTAGGVRDASAHLAMNQTVNRMMGRAASSILIGRMGVLAIQTTQLAAGLAEMPTGSFAVRFGKLLTGHLGWGAALKSDYIQRRIKQMPVSVQQAMEGLRASKPNILKHNVAKLGLLIGGADGLFTAGTFAIVHDYQLKQAKSMGLSGADAESYAIKAAERAVDRVAQPTRPGTRSLFENQSTNPAMRVLWAFASEGRQKLALALWRAGASDRTLGEKARAAAVTWVVGGLVATVIRSAMRDVKDDDDDETFDEKNWGAKRLALSTLTGPFQGLPFIGDALEAGVYKVAGEYNPEGNMFSSVPTGLKAFSNVGNWGDNAPDRIMKDVEAILSAAALADPTGNSSAASSLSHLARDLFGIVNNAAN